MAVGGRHDYIEPYRSIDWLVTKGVSLLEIECCNRKPPRLTLGHHHPQPLRLPSKPVQREDSRRAAQGHRTVAAAGPHGMARRPPGVRDWHRRSRPPAGDGPLRFRCSLMRKL